MTRDEAINILRKKPNGGSSAEEITIDAFVALGILKLDDGAKNANDLFHERMSNHYGLTNRESFLRRLDAAGLKIVEK